MKDVFAEEQFLQYELENARSGKGTAILIRGSGSSVLRYLQQKPPGSDTSNSVSRDVSIRITCYRETSRIPYYPLRGLIRKLGDVTQINVDSMLPHFYHQAEGKGPSVTSYPLLGELEFTEGNHQRELIEQAITSQKAIAEEFWQFLELSAKTLLKREKTSVENPQRDGALIIILDGVNVADHATMMCIEHTTLHVHEAPILLVLCGNTDFWHSTADHIVRYQLPPEDYGENTPALYHSIPTPPDKDYQSVLVMAGFLGMRFSQEHVKDLYHTARGRENSQYIGEVLAWAREQGIVELLEDGAYCFCDETLRKILLTQLSSEMEHEYHLMFAETLETSGRNNSDTLFHIAYHYNQTGNNRKRQKYNKAAFDQAMKLNSLQDAVYYGACIIESFLDTQNTDPQAVAFTVYVSDIFYMTGNIEVALELLKKMLSLCKNTGEIGDHIELCRAIGAGYYYANDFSSSLEWQQRALKLVWSSETQDPIQRGMLHYYMGSNCWFLGDIPQAVENLDLAVAECAGNPGVLLPCLALRLASYLVAGRVGEAEQDMEWMLRIIPEDTSNIHVPHAWHCCSLFYSNTHRDNDIALDFSQRSLNKARESGNALFVYSALFGMALAELHRKRYDQAEKCIHESLDLANTQNVLVGISLVHGYRALISFAAGRHEEAFSRANEYLAINKKSEERISYLIFMKVTLSYLYRYCLPECSIKLTSLLKETWLVEVPLYAAFFWTLADRLGLSYLKPSHGSSASELPQLADVFEYELNWIQDIAHERDRVFALEESTADWTLALLGLHQLYEACSVPESAVQGFVSALLRLTRADVVFLEIPQIDGFSEQVVYSQRQSRTKGWGTFEQGINTMSKVELPLIDRLRSEARSMVVPTLFLQEQPSNFELHYYMQQAKVKKACVVPVSFLGQGHSCLSTPAGSVPTIGALFILLDSDGTQLRIPDTMALLSMAGTMLLRYIQAGSYQKTHEQQMDLFQYMKQSPGDHGISNREVEVIRLVLQGRSNRSIAEGLSISEYTVKTHLYNIFRKLGITSRAELITRVQQKL